MVHVARGQLTDAERVLRHGAAIQDRQIGRGERYPALGLHWLLGLVRLAQDDTREAIDEFDRERALAAPHRLYGREYTMHAHVGHGAALLRTGRRDDAARIFRARTDRLSRASTRPRLGWRSPRARLSPWTRLHEAADRAQSQPLRWGVWTKSATMLASVLDAAPPGFTGWSLPVEPSFPQVTDNKALT